MGIVGILFGVFLIYVINTSNTDTQEPSAEHPISVTGTVSSVNSRYETLQDEDSEQTVCVYDIQATYTAENGIQKTAYFYNLSKAYKVGSEIPLLCREDLSDPIIASSAEEMDDFTRKFIYGVGGISILIGLFSIIVPFVKNR